VTARGGFAAALTRVSGSAKYYRVALLPGSVRPG
jgi:hypothetical protein